MGLINKCLSQQTGGFDELACASLNLTCNRGKCQVSFQSLTTILCNFMVNLRDISGMNKFNSSLCKCTNEERRINDKERTNEKN